MAILSVNTITRAALADTLAAAAGGGDTFENDGAVWLEVNNGHSSAQTVNVAGTADGQTVTNLRSYSIPNGARRKIGPFPPAIYNNADGRVALTYSGVTSLTVGVFRLS